MEEALGSASRSDVDPLSQSGHTKGGCEHLQGPFQGSVCRPYGLYQDESTRDWVASLDNMTLNKVVLPAGESVYQDAKGRPMPPQRWPTEFHYVDGGLEQAHATDSVCVNRVIGDPWRQCFAVSPVNVGESEHLLSDAELDLVQGYMDRPFHDWVTLREGKGQDKACWEVDAIVSGSYDGNTFVRRVLDHLSSQDERIGGNPATYGDLFKGKAQDGPMGHLGRPPEPKTNWIATPQVSSVVQVPGKAKAESDECLKIQALRARLKQKYGDSFFSRKPVFPPPVRGPYGEAKIRLKPDPKVYPHREFALRGERKEAMERTKVGWSPVTLSGPPAASSYPRRWPGNGGWWSTTAA